MQMNKLIYTVVKFGRIDGPKVTNALAMANSAQNVFSFEQYPHSIPFRNIKRYTIPSGGFDIDGAILDFLSKNRMPRPLIFITSEPYGDRDLAYDPDNYYFCNEKLSPNEQNVGVISTHLWEKTAGGESIERYLLYIISYIVLAQISKLSCHPDTRGCIFDDCDNPNDIRRSMISSPKFLCKEECESTILQIIRSESIGIQEIAAIRKLYNRSVKRKECFIAMPFRPGLDKIFARFIKPTLESIGWTVLRVDKNIFTRNIIDDIRYEILACDLMIADLTRKNPNVLYEVGLAHGMGYLTLFISQQRKLPFDLNSYLTIFYKNTKSGLSRLTKGLIECAKITTD